MTKPFDHIEQISMAKSHKKSHKNLLKELKKKKMELWTSFLARPTTKYLSALTAWIAETAAEQLVQCTRKKTSRE